LKRHCQKPDNYMTMHHLHVFLSSPGDVSRERQLVREVIDRLQSERAYRDRFKLEVVAWDKPGAGTRMPAHLEPQEAINRELKKPSECDVVIVIFWARMGTPLSDNYRKTDGSRYRSGTEYEFLDGFNAAKTAGKPEVWVYRKNQAPSVQLDDPEHDEKMKQWNLVEDFFSQFRNPDSSYRTFCKEYDEPFDFKELLDQDLRDFITSYLEDHPLEKAEIPLSSDEPTWDQSRAPFPGLRAFTSEEALIFYGRGRQTDELIDELSKSNKRFIAVVGASGSGKSSLVAAGLLPALENNAIYGSKDWVRIRFTPAEVGDNPFMALANAFKSTTEGHGRRLRDIAKELETDPDSLQHNFSMALDGRPNWAEVLVFIDQFEELFTLVDEKYQSGFVDILARAAKTDRVRTIVTMRADFYHRCLEWPVLSELLTEGHYPLLAPKTGALYEMITRPADRAGLKFEKGLAQRILDDTGTEPGALALMAFALFELWNEPRGAGRSLTYAAYESFNAVHGAIGKRAEDTFSVLKGEKSGLEAAFTLVFRELVEVNERGRATRRRARLSRVTADPLAEALVQNLTDARLLVTGRGEGNEAMVEMAHEAIFTSWPRLTRWIDDHAFELRACRNLTRAAREWQDAGAPLFSHLPDRAALKQYRRVRPLCSLGEDAGVIGRFLAASHRRQRLWSAFLAFFVLVVSLGSVDIWLRSHEMNWNVLQIWVRAQVGLYGGPSMVEIPGGTFGMGASDCISDKKSNECPQHPVMIRLFWIGKYEITFDEYSAFILDTDGFELPHDEGWGRGSRPVIRVGWEDARAYTAWLKEVTGKSFRLPTEAEWEYAVRAGSTTGFFFGDDAGKLGEYAWYNDNSEGETHPVGQKKPNAWGLYDMHGNVWEWVEDDWHDDYEDAPEDERAWIDKPRGADRVVRGGSWLHDARLCRSARRYGSSPDYRYFGIGFRLARSVALGS
jgi:formylglycine-generating enzyme required for sulfatase activity